MAYKTISTEATYRIGLFMEQAERLGAQAELLRIRSEQSLARARQLMLDAGLNPDTDQLAGDGVTFNGETLDPGTVMRNRQPIKEKDPDWPPLKEQSPDAEPTATQDSQ